MTIQDKIRSVKKREDVAVKYNGWWHVGRVTKKYGEKITVLLDERANEYCLFEATGEEIQDIILLEKSKA